MAHPLDNNTWTVARTGLSSYTVTYAAGSLTATTNPNAAGVTGTLAIAGNYVLASERETSGPVWHRLVNTASPLAGNVADSGSTTVTFTVVP